MDLEQFIEIENETNEDQKDYKPLWSLDSRSEEDEHKWLKNEFYYLLRSHKGNNSLSLENLLLYQGTMFSPNDQKTINDFLNTSKSGNDKRRQRLIINHLFDLTETLVSRSTMQRPEPEVLPANSNEIHDRNAAEGVLQILKYIHYINDIDRKDIKFKRLSKICGEAYLSCLWNPEMGDISPIWAKAKANDFKTKEGKQLKDHKGKKIDNNNIIHVGEVEVKVWEPWKVFVESKDCWDDVNYCFLVELAHVDELKDDYPKRKDKIKCFDKQTVLDTNKMVFRKLRNETYKIHFYHKKTKYMPKGYHAIFTLDTMLDYGDFPYAHNKLPIIRLTDIDVPGVLHGMSFYEMAKNIQWRHNQLSSDIITNIRLCAKPKWIVPKGKCKLEALGNDITIAQYSGNVKPELVSTNPTPLEVFNFRDMLEKDLGKIATVTDIARRNVPKQIHASVAMSFLTELESVRTSTSTSKHNDAIKELYIMMMSVAGQYYDESDGRTIRILGGDNEFLIRDINISNLSKPYDVIIKNSGSLPEMRATKEARIFDVLKVRPNLFSDPQLIDTLQLGSSKKITTIVTESLRAAESENEKFFRQGEFVKEPAPYEDLIVHWKTHVQKLQSNMIKNYADLEDIVSLEEHIWATEFLMFEKGKENATFSAELASLKMFPIYYKENSDFKPSSRKQQELVVQGQANRGDNITESIGSEPSDLDTEKMDILQQKEQGNK